MTDKYDEDVVIPAIEALQISCGLEAIKELIRQKSTNERDRLRNELADMQCAIIGWQEGLAFNSADDLISALDEMITKTLKDTEAETGKD